LRTEAWYAHIGFIKQSSLYGYHYWCKNQLYCICYTPLFMLRQSYKKLLWNTNLYINSQPPISIKVSGRVKVYTCTFYLKGTIFLIVLASWQDWVKSTLNSPGVVGYNWIVHIIYQILYILLYDYKNNIQCTVPSSIHYDCGSAGLWFK
jgi:hypothetical protein